ncbi:MAG: flavodoxin family protein [Armatimonadia bacterium]|nr:flavodoxin family protein [Armatimonadia bacterium]
MQITVIHTSPNEDGLTANLARAACEGAADAGASAELIKVTDYEVASCWQCDNGWYKCRDEGWCVIEDQFQEMRAKVQEADAWVLVTPVYFGEISESAKCFTDRLRRCNVGAKGEGLAVKPVIGVAAAGGSGRGTATCLLQMDRLFSHISAEIADLITVTQRSSEYKREAIRAAARAMVEAVE